MSKDFDPSITAVEDRASHPRSRRSRPGPRTARSRRFGTSSASSLRAEVTSEEA